MALGKTVQSIAWASVLLASPVLAQGPSGPPQLILDYYVDVNAPTQPTDPGIGTEQTPAKSITWILTNKRPNVQDRVRIFVAPGTYDGAGGAFEEEVWPISIHNVELIFWDRAGVLPNEPDKVEFLAGGTLEPAFEIEAIPVLSSLFVAGIEGDLPVQNPSTSDPTFGFVINGFKEGVRIFDDFNDPVKCDLSLSGIRTEDTEIGLRIDLENGVSELAAEIHDSRFYGATAASGMSVSLPLVECEVESPPFLGINCELDFEDVSFFPRDQSRNAPAVRVLSTKDADCRVDMKSVSVLPLNGLAPATVGLAFKTNKAGLKVKLDTCQVKGSLENGVLMEAGGKSSKPESFEATGCVFVQNGSANTNGNPFKFVSGAVNALSDDSGVWIRAEDNSDGIYEKVQISQTRMSENYEHGLRFSATGRRDDNIAAFPDAIVSKCLFRRNGAEVLPGSGLYVPARGALVEMTEQENQWKIDFRRSLFKQNSSGGVWSEVFNSTAGQIYIANCVVTESLGELPPAAAANYAYTAPVGIVFQDYDESWVEFLVECCTITNNISPHALAIWTTDSRLSEQTETRFVDTGIFFGGLKIHASILSGNAHPDVPGVEHWLYPMPSTVPANNTLFDYIYEDSTLCHLGIVGAPAGIYPGSNPGNHIWAPGDPIFLKPFSLNGINYGVTFPDSSVSSNFGRLIDQTNMSWELDIPGWVGASGFDIRGTRRQILWTTGEFEFDPPPWYPIDLGAFELDMGE